LATPRSDLPVPPSRPDLHHDPQALSVQTHPVRECTTQLGPAYGWPTLLVFPPPVRVLSPTAPAYPPLPFVAVKLAERRPTPLTRSHQLVELLPPPSDKGLPSTCFAESAFNLLGTHSAPAARLRSGLRRCRGSSYEAATRSSWFRETAGEGAVLEACSRRPLSGAAILDRNTAAVPALWFIIGNLAAVWAVAARTCLRRCYGWWG